MRQVRQGNRFVYRTHGAGFGTLTVELLRVEDEDKTFFRLGEVRARMNQCPPRLRQTLYHLAIWLADFFGVPDERVLPDYHPQAHDYSPSYDDRMRLEESQEPPCLF